MSKSDEMHDASWLHGLSCSAVHRPLKRTRWIEPSSEKYSENFKVSQCAKLGHFTHFKYVKWHTGLGLSYSASSVSSHALLVSQMTQFCTLTHFDVFCVYVIITTTYEGGYFKSEIANILWHYITGQTEIAINADRSKNTRRMHHA